MFGRSEDRYQMARRALALARSRPLTRMIALWSVTAERGLTSSVFIFARLWALTICFCRVAMNSSGNESREGEMLKWDQALYVR